MRRDDFPAPREGIVLSLGTLLTKLNYSQRFSGL